MKILYDHQTFHNQNYGGISRYFCELISQYNRDPKVQIELSLKYTDNDNIRKLYPNVYPKELIDKNYYDFLPNYYFKGKHKLFRLSRYLQSFYHKDSQTENLNRSITLLRQGDFDIFHPTYYDPYFLNYLDGKPFVLTVYDLIHDIYPEFFPLNEGLRESMRLLVNKAAAIIAISNQTKQDLIYYYDVAPNKIDVIYLASSLNPNSLKASTKFALPQKYFLYVGNRTIYKNFYFLIKIYSKLLHIDPNIHLICCGGYPFSREEHYYFHEQNVHDNIHYVSATDENLIYLYRHAMALISPSIYEGFNIPLVEAMSCGCLVVASQAPPNQEIGGDGLLFFNSKDIKSGLEQILKVCRDQINREKLVKQGIRISQNYNWNKVAQQTHAVYQRVIKKTHEH